ncbi:hypothetical protein P4054_29185 [Pseudomonas aeruginosa]|nr:hypothetical protein [Pseudomonas aeruginosa]
MQNNPYSSKGPTVAQLSGGPFTRYHLFATAAYLHLHVEIAAGQFRPVMIGSLNKRGVEYSGGQYVRGSVIYQAGQMLTSSWSCHPFDGYHVRYSDGGCVLRVMAWMAAPRPTGCHSTTRRTSPGGSSGQAVETTEVSTILTSD